MSEALEVEPHDKVLEVGTGSGYQTAILGELAAEVYSVEIIPEVAERATRLLERLGYAHVHVRHADGYAGWPERAPFDAIVVTAAPDHVPPPLIDQLRIGGRLVVPVGRGDQDLLVLTRTPDGTHEESRLPVRFVPLTRGARPDQQVG
jgi:protein-L-isoaspartate(D-aspartate) O-methyltransferase